MKKFFWPVACTFIIITLLYGRTFFLEQDKPAEKISPKTPPVASQLILPSPTPAPADAKLVFPPRYEPLVLPAYTYPPFSMQNESGKWIGADNEIIEAVLQRLGYRVVWLEMPFARALEEMKSGKYPAMTACVEGDGREEYILFSDPISSIYSVLWQKRSDPFSWTTYDDLDGKLIGASYYHYGAGFFEAAEAGKFKLDMVAAEEPEIVHFRKLLQGKTDMFISELSLGLHLQQKHKPEFNEVVPSPTGVGPARPFSFAISRKYFNNKEEQLHDFVKTFNDELLAFAGEGRRDAIFAKYHMSIQVDKEGKIITPVQQ